MWWKYKIRDRRGADQHLDRGYLWIMWVSCMSTVFCTFLYVSGTSEFKILNSCCCGKSVSWYNWFFGWQFGNNHVKTALTLHPELLPSVLNRRDVVAHVSRDTRAQIFSTALCEEADGWQRPNSILEHCYRNSDSSRQGSPVPPQGEREKRALYMLIENHRQDRQFGLNKASTLENSHGEGDQEAGGRHLYGPAVSSAFLPHKCTVPKFLFNKRQHVNILLF